MCFPAKKAIANTIKAPGNKYAVIPSITLKRTGDQPACDAN